MNAEKPSNEQVFPTACDPGSSLLYVQVFVLVLTRERKIGALHRLAGKNVIVTPYLVSFDAGVCHAPVKLSGSRTSDVLVQIKCLFGTSYEVLRTTSLAGSASNCTSGSCFMFNFGRSRTARTVSHYLIWNSELTNLQT